MSLLGIDFDIQGYIFKPFYLCLGVLYFITLLSLLGTLYVVLCLRHTLENLLNTIENNIKKYNR
jgi:hypothetical protein